MSSTNINSSISTVDTSTTSTNTVNSPISTVNTSTTSTNVSNTNTTTVNTVSEWNEQTIRLLINQRKYRNSEYYQIIGRSRTNYWSSIARRINGNAGTNFTRRQCRRKFNNLVSHYHVSNVC